MARRQSEPEILECIEPHVMTDGKQDYVWRRGDRATADHPGIHDRAFWLPTGFTLNEELDHRKARGLYGRR